jgi:hypothetical protein
MPPSRSLPPELWGRDVSPSHAANCRPGFHAPPNYYRAIYTFFAVANRALAGCVIKQPSFFLTGEADGLNAVRNPPEASLRQTLPGLRGFLAMKGVGIGRNSKRLMPSMQRCCGFSDRKPDTVH